MRANLDIHVFFTPTEIINISRKGHADDVYIVVDVIRATTTLSVMFDRGASRVFAAENVEQAREAAHLFPGRLLCGERNARPLPGFDYGNSPSEFSRLDLTGRELILATTNGTRAFYACPEEATRLAGSFYNAQAVAVHTLALAQERGGNIAIVCAGELGYFAIEDATCAGYLVLELQRQHARNSQGKPLNLWGSAQAAVSIYEKLGPQHGIAQWHAAQEVIQAGLYDDPGFCVQMSVSTSVPVVVGHEVLAPDMRDRHAGGASERLRPSVRGRVAAWPAKRLRPTIRGIVSSLSSGHVSKEEGTGLLVVERA